MSEKNYYGLMNDAKLNYTAKEKAACILWVGPITKDEMEYDFDIFRHNIADGVPKLGRIISKEEALKINDEYYG